MLNCPRVTYVCVYIYTCLFFHAQTSQQPYYMYSCDLQLFFLLHSYLLSANDKWASILCMHMVLWLLYVTIE